MDLRNTIDENSKISYNSHGKRKFKPMADVIEKRNTRLLYLFREWYKKSTNDDNIRLVDCIRLFGNEQNPAVIYKNDTLLACYCNNFDLKLLDKNDRGNTLSQIKLTEDINPDSFQLLDEWIVRAEHKPAYRISLVDTNLYVNGYHFIDSVNKMGERYPIFADVSPRIYLKHEFADKIVEEFKNNYNLVVV